MPVDVCPSVVTDWVPAAAAGRDRLNEELRDPESDGVVIVNTVTVDFSFDNEPSALRLLSQINLSLVQSLYHAES